MWEKKIIIFFSHIFFSPLCQLRSKLPLLGRAVAPY